MNTDSGRCPRYQDVVKKLVGSREMRSDREVVYESVKQFGVTLAFVSDELRADRDIVLAAVQKHGLALKFASPELRADPVLRSWAKLKRPLCLWRKLREQVSARVIVAYWEGQCMKAVIKDGRAVMVGRAAKRLRDEYELLFEL